MQEGRQPVVVDNTHNILAAAAVQFNEVLCFYKCNNWFIVSSELLNFIFVFHQGQANHLFNLITASWVKETSKARQRLLLLLSKLGNNVRKNE